MSGRPGMYSCSSKPCEIAIFNGVSAKLTASKFKSPNMPNQNQRLTACALSGFTLLEVVVSIAIISIAFFTLIGVFTYSLSVNTKAQNLTSAAYLGQAGIEKSLSLGYDSLPAGMLETKARLSNDPENFLYPFWRQIEVIHVDTNLAPSVTETGLKKITSAVFWHNPLSAEEQQYILTTLLSKN